MAVFLINSCKFKGCSLVFETLAELIQHVEEAHLDLDPKVIEKQQKELPASLPLSQVLKFYAGAKPKKSLLGITAKKIRQRNNSIMSTSASIRSLTPTSSEYDFDDEDVEGDLDNIELQTKGPITAEQQWTNQLILNMVSNRAYESEKPYACKVKGCRKRYKNINGVKYHARNGHKREARLAKFTSKCFCGKSFGSVKQLEIHTEVEHSLSSLGLTSLDMEQDLNPLVKDEPLVPVTSLVEGKPPLSIIHPITISGGVLLTPTTSKHLKTVSKGEILVTHKFGSTATSTTATSKALTVSSLVTSSSLVTPPTTPQKRPATVTVSTPISSSLAEYRIDEKQQAINEKVARALAAAKQAMEAAASKTISVTQTTTPCAVINTKQ